MVADAGEAMVEYEAASAVDRCGTAWVAAADEEVADAAKWPVEVRLVPAPWDVGGVHRGLEWRSPRDWRNENRPARRPVAGFQTDAMIVDLNDHCCLSLRDHAVTGTGRDEWQGTSVGRVR